MRPVSHPLVVTCTIDIITRGNIIGQGRSWGQPGADPAHTGV